MSELINCINNLTAEDIVRGIAKTANGTPFYLTASGGADPCADFVNLVTNSGGMVDGVLCDTDWINAVGGVAAGWTFATGAGSCSIVTGNDFIGNAQRMNHVTGTTSQLQFFDAFNDVENNEVYKISFKYRSDIASRVYLRGSSDPFTIALPINTGNATEYNGILVCSDTADLRLNFYVLAATASGYVEIDEVRLWKDTPMQGTNLLINCGASGTTDWVDTNIDGIADNWIHFEGTGTPAIVTGNGFTGNAQRIGHGTGTNTHFRQDTGIAAVSGAFYIIEFKYRSDQQARVSLRAGGDYFTAVLPVNTGNAIFTRLGVAATGTNNFMPDFYILSAKPNCYLEIDDIVLYKL